MVAAACAVAAWLPAPGGANPSHFASKAGYIADAFITSIHPGAVLWVDRIGNDPRCIEVLCTATDFGGNIILEDTQLDGAQYREQASQPTLGALGEMLQDINNATPRPLLGQVEMRLANVISRTLGAETLSRPLANANKRCLLRMAQAMHERTRPRGWPVVMTSELLADVTIKVRWQSPLLPSVERIMVMFKVADYLNVNGGRISSDLVWAGQQRIGWQHDQGSNLGDFTAAAGRAQPPNSRRFAPRSPPP